MLLSKKYEIQMNVSTYDEAQELLEYLVNYHEIKPTDAYQADSIADMIETLEEFSLQAFEEIDWPLWSDDEILYELFD